MPAPLGAFEARRPDGAAVPQTTSWPIASGNRKSVDAQLIGLVVCLPFLWWSASSFRDKIMELMNKP